MFECVYVHLTANQQKQQFTVLDECRYPIRLVPQVYASNSTVKVQHQTNMAAELNLQNSKIYEIIHKMYQLVVILQGGFLYVYASIGKCIQKDVTTWKSAIVILVTYSQCCVHIIINIINWITKTRKSGKQLCMTYGTTGQSILWSPPLEIKPATTDCRGKTLPLCYWSKSHTYDAKLTSHG